MCLYERDIIVFVLQLQSVGDIAMLSSPFNNRKYSRLAGSCLPLVFSSLTLYISDEIRLYQGDVV